MKTLIKGQLDSTLVIHSTDEVTQIPCKDCIAKLWLSDGTILGVKYSRGGLYPNVWKIRVLHSTEDSYIYTPCWDADDSCNTDMFETDCDVVNWKVIPRSMYMGDLINDEQ
jgi:hypothetical protein